MLRKAFVKPEPSSFLDRKSDLIITQRREGGSERFLPSKPDTQQAHPKSN